MKNLYQTEAYLMKLSPSDAITSSRPIHESCFTQKFLKANREDVKTSGSIGFEIKNSKR